MQGLVLNRWVNVICAFLFSGAMAVPAFESHSPATSARLSVEGGLRIQQGEALELVYNGPLLLSELTWDIQDLVYAGVTLQWWISRNWLLALSYWEAVTEGSGGMTDYDFFIPGIWTDFSDGPVDVNRAYMVDLQADWRFWQMQGSHVSLHGGYRQMHWDWSQYGGMFVYSSGGFRNLRGTFPADQNGINYKQTFQIPYAGLGFGTRYARWQIDMYAHYSPFARADALDEHVLRGLFFEDRFDLVDYYAAGAAASYHISDRWYVNGAWDWHRTPASRGDIRIIDVVEETEERVENAAGIANQAWSLSLAAGVRF
jgi:outer membrane protease